MNREVIARRLASRLDQPNDRGCRLWNRCTNEYGYGRMVIDGTEHGAHRVAFYLEYGYWPEICRHGCDTPACCEPTHLLDGTYFDNLQDCIDRGRYVNGMDLVTHCPQGHPYDEENTSYRANGWRVCRTCRRDRLRALRLRKKEMAS